MPFLRRSFGGGGGGGGSSARRSPSLMGVERSLGRSGRGAGGGSGSCGVLATLFPSLPARVNSFPSNRGSLRCGQAGSPRLPALGRPQLAQADSEWVARVWEFWWLWRCFAGRLADDLIGKLVRIARPLFTCSGRHGPIVPRRTRRWETRKNFKLDHHPKD